MLWTGAQICLTVLKSFPKFSSVLIRMDIIVNLEKVLQRSVLYKVFFNSLGVHVHVPPTSRTINQTASHVERLF